MAMDMNMDAGTRLRDRIVEVFGNAGAFPDQAISTLQAASPTGELSWYIGVFAKGLVYIFIAVCLSLWARRWLRRTFAPSLGKLGNSRAEQIGFLWSRALLQALSVVVFMATGAVLAFALRADSDAEASKHVEILTQLVMLGAVAIWQLFYYFFLNLLAPDLSSHRRLPLTTEVARGMHRSLTVVFAISISIAAVIIWMHELALPRDSHILMLLSGSILMTGMLSSLVFRYRLEVAQALAGHCNAEERRFVRLIGQNWHVFVILYFVGSFCVTAYRLILDLPSAIGLILEPAVLVLLAIAVYGLALVVIDRVTKSETVSVPADPEDTDRPSLKRLAEHAAAILVAAGAFGATLEIWGLDVTSDNSIVVALADILIVGFLGYLAFEAIKIAIDRKIEAEGGFEAPEPGDEGGAAGSASRLATLLPMFRNFLLITVAVIVGMIILSQLGVDIAPLFAGAGVVGLAVGFGAQTLIRDIFSGAFFLVDDAFRKGEYIDLGSVKGTVEKISIRSMQLRHHLGALHTIPFGEITQLTNYSRDWAMMKLTLRVTYDTDVERVRKLIKKLGQELLEHPEVGDKFIQPLKSQGVYSMEDSAMILRVKFMTKPGEQFVVRKLVYARIRELFAQEGIQFAHREVTVRVAGEGSEKISDKEKEAITGAVLPPPDGEAQPAPSGR